MEIAQARTAANDRRPGPCAGAAGGGGCTPTSDAAGNRRHATPRSAAARLTCNRCTRLPTARPPHPSHLARAAADASAPRAAGPRAAARRARARRLCRRAAGGGCGAGPGDDVSRRQLSYHRGGARVAVQPGAGDEGAQSKEGWWRRPESKGRGRGGRGWRRRRATRHQHPLRGHPHPHLLSAQAELILGQGASATVKCATDATLWVVPAGDLRQLAATRPDLLLEVGGGADRAGGWLCCSLRLHAGVMALHASRMAPRADCTALAPRSHPARPRQVGLRISQEMTGRVNLMTAEKQVPAFFRALSSAPSPVPPCRAGV